jgi:hypothetical protein
MDREKTLVDGIFASAPGFVAQVFSPPGFPLFDELKRFGLHSN